MRAILVNASVHIDHLAGLAAAAGATAYSYDMASDSLICEDVSQAALDAAVAGYVPPGPSADDVRAEASRRMQLIVGARDAAHLEIVIANASREAIRLLRIGAANWTEAQAARAGQLETVDAMIEHIRARSNALEPAPPADYADDRHWT